MELPINAIIILFVAIITAYAVIQFSSDTVEKADREITDLAKKNSQKFVLELSTTGLEKQLAYLALECYKKGLNTVMDSPTCYVVKLQDSTGKPDTYDLSTAETDIETAWTDLGQDVNNLEIKNPNTVSAIFINYDVAGKVIITP